MHLNIETKHFKIQKITKENQRFVKDIIEDSYQVIDTEKRIVIAFLKPKTDEYQIEAIGNRMFFDGDENKILQCAHLINATINLLNLSKFNKKF